MWTIKSFSMAFRATLNITDSPESFLECRICHNGHEDGAVESYCFCRGSNGFLHQKCLLHWLAVSGRNACEICLRPYEIQQGRLHWCWKWKIPSSSNNLGLILRCVLLIGMVTTSAFSLKDFIVIMGHNVKRRYQSRPNDHQGDIHFEVALQFLLMVISPILISVYLAYNVWALMKPILLANRTLRVIPTKGPFQIPFSTVETISPLVAPNAVVDCIL